MDIDIYGIGNCDTMKRARAWLSAQGLDYRFHDYRKQGVDGDLLAHWCDAAGWQSLLNRKGTTWRSLPEADRADVDRSRAMALMMAHPSLIKRPVLMVGEAIEVGFSEDRYRALFA